MNLRWSKKASLNLSVEAIVIVVIAFTVLGLGLGFVKDQIGKMKETSTSVQEQISQQILEDLRTGNKKLSFPATKLTIETGAESVQAIGVKNTADQAVTLVLEFQVKGSDGFTPFTSEEELTYTSGEAEVIAKISWDNSDQTLKPGESRVYPITITAPDKSGNYLYKVILRKTSDGSVFDEKTFFVKTT